jgi:hypothetical protein
MDFELDVRQWLQGLTFPASRRRVVDYARQQGAPAFVVLALENLPTRRYRSVGDVAEHLTTIWPRISPEDESEAA